MSVAVAHRLFTVNTLEGPCGPKYASGKWVMFVGMSMYAFVCVCWRLAASGMPAKGRAADGSGAQPIPVI